MEPFKEEGNLDEKTLKTVLHEFEEEHKELKEIIIQQQILLKELAIRQTSLENTLVHTDLKLIKERNQYKKDVKAKLESVYQYIQQQPKSITRQYRVQLFPEYNNAEYYRIVYGRLLGWFVLVLTIYFLYTLGTQYIDRSQVVRQKALEADHYKKSWDYLYHHEKKEMRKRMDTAWERNQHRP